MGHCSFFAAEKVALGQGPMHIRRGWLLGKTLKHSVLIGVQWAVLSTKPRPRSKIFSKFGFTSPPGFTGYSIQWPLLNALCHYYVLNKQFSEFQNFTFWGDWEVEEMNMNITVNDPSTLSFLSRVCCVRWTHFLLTEADGGSHKNWNLCKHDRFQRTLSYSVMQFLWKPASVSE